MASVGLAKWLVSLSSYIKPVLAKILPLKIKNRLRDVKAGMISSSVSSVVFLPFDRAKNPDGINLTGYVTGEIGLGQSCRILAEILDAGDINFTLYNVENPNLKNTDSRWNHKITNSAAYNINLIHINPLELPYVFLETGKEIWDYRYNIGFWLWELEDFPDEWINSFHLVNEIWTPSEFVSDSIRKKTSLPVRTVPYAISALTDESFDRTAFGLPKDVFLFLFMGDGNSVLSRKNPTGTIEAYKKAFSSDDTSVGLILKITNALPDDLEAIRDSLKGYPNITILTDVLSKTAVNSLIQCSDVFVSLHRAEGFGLVLAEAMYLGVPVIATNWSANTGFMNCETACPVDYKLVELEQDFGPFKKGNRWALPDTGHAASYMKKLRDDPVYYDCISRNAREYIKRTLNTENSSKIIAERIMEIYSEYSVNKQ